MTPRRRIEAEFNVKLHERTVGTYLAKLGFRWLSVRPEHPNADPAAQAAFKKLRKYRSGYPARTRAWKTIGSLVSDAMRTDIIDNGRCPTSTEGSHHVSEYNQPRERYHHCDRTQPINIARCRPLAGSR